MSSLFHTILTEPLLNALVFLYNTVAFQDLGLAIILLTVLVRFILYPLFYKGLKNQAMMQKIQPHLEEIKEKHKDDKEKQALEMMALWKEHKINPFSGFLLLIVQLPVLWAIYRVFFDGLNAETFKSLYPFISAPEQVNQTLFGFVDLTQTSIAIVVLATVLTYVQARMAAPKKKEGEKESKAAVMSKRMTFIVPGIIFIFLINFASAIGLYILTTTVFSIFQQKIINNRIHGKDGKDGQEPAAA
ncbi:MAG: YidC/Oxa1 family membrane protein insertase [bacterium]|nr:YidC/Oxa1 family membrane protein insertase [bacterium]